MADGIAGAVDADPDDARRAAQLGIERDGATVVEDVRERDRMDRSRRVSPLVAADEAIAIDTGGQSVAESLQAMLEVIRAAS